MMRHLLTATPLLLLVADCALAQPAACYDWLLRERLRGGYLAASDPRAAAAEMKAAGMNAVLPKFGGLTCPPDAANRQLLREWSEATQKAGLRLLPVFNFRGSETERLLGNRREMTRNGQRMEKTPCPLDEQFWQVHIFSRAVDLAARGKSQPIAGAIIDPEMYGADHTTFAECCYCDDCLREFLLAAGQALPEPLPAPAARADWLKDRQFATAFEQRFVERIRRFCETLERAVHAANPDFLLGVFLLDYPVPCMRGMAQGLGTASHPVLGFSETTYPLGYTGYVAAQQKTFAAMPAHVLFLPGLWLAKFPTENLAEQCYACGRHAAGYWIYTFESLVEDTARLPPGYRLSEPPERYWAAMKQANAELDRFAGGDGKYESALKVRPFDAPLQDLAPEDVHGLTLRPVAAASPLSLGPETFPRLRYRNPLYILAKAGEPVTVKVSNRQLNVNYRFRTQYAGFDAAGQRIIEGVVKLGESGTAPWTPRHDGLYVVVADSDQNGYALEVVTRQPFAYRATPKRPLTVNGVLGRIYFHVPAGIGKFALFVRAEGQAPGRGGKLTVYAPDGQVAASVAGDLGAPTELPVTVPPTMANRVWALAGEDITNDLTLYFSPNMPGWLGTDPARLLGPTVTPGK